MHAILHLVLLAPQKVRQGLFAQDLATTESLTPPVWGSSYYSCEFSMGSAKLSSNLGQLIKWPGITKSNTLHSSRKRFWIGVPVSISLCGVSIRFTVRVTLLVGVFDFVSLVQHHVDERILKNRLLVDAQRLVADDAHAVVLHHRVDQLLTHRRVARVQVTTHAVTDTS